MAVLLVLAYAVGGVVRFNIQHVERRLEQKRDRDPVIWTAAATQIVLAMAYAVSVAYYLKLLAEFMLKAVPVSPSWHGGVSNIAVTVLIVSIAVVAYLGGPRRVGHVAEGSVSIKLGIIAGLLVGIAIWWGGHAGHGEPLPPVKLSLASIPMLLGLLITVQGFETSRYLGETFPRDVRIATMRHAQWIASAVYLGFLALLTPFLASASHAQGVAGIVDIMALVAAPLTVFVLIGAVASQLSAAVADSIGSAGLLNEITRRKLSLTAAFGLTSALAIAVVWLTDPFQVVAVASRAFALFYAMQCVLAVMVSRDAGAGHWRRAGFVLLGLICVAAALAGAPAEG
ncbi:MAG: hypothetical protein M3R41_09290 [Pseudomonadota bacterium]|nr:hypothetical protein [Pseudomonadota bacterium]